MPWKTNNFLFAVNREALLFLVASFFLAGCATKPWLEPLGSSETESTLQLVDALVARDAVCGKTLEGDLDLFYQTPLEKKALSGFLQFSMPSSYKFVVSNPFGQPILAVAGDQESFQAINVGNQSYLAGSLSSFGLRNNISSSLLQSDWSFLLTGRNLFPSQTITKIYEDRNQRGIWLTSKPKNKTRSYHLLLDRDQEVVVACVLENDSGDTVAEIHYDNWVTLGGCRQPLDITISGLDYGTEVQIKLSNVSTSDERKTYTLQPPPGYRRQYMP
jgi:hypothetical protein